MWAAAISPWEWPMTAVGVDAVVLPESGEGDVDGEEGGLDDVDSVWCRGWCWWCDGVEDVEVGVGVEGFVAGGEVFGEGGVGVVELVSHAGPLGALAGEDEDDAGGAGAMVWWRGVGRRPADLRRQEPVSSSPGSVAMTTAAVRQGWCGRWPGCARPAAGLASWVQRRASRAAARPGRGSASALARGEQPGHRSSVAVRLVDRQLPVAGACSRMRWALVPLMPKEETAARRGRSCSGHGVAR